MIRRLLGGHMDKNRVISAVLFVGFLVVFNVCSYLFNWPIFLY